jgi:hypothetical protein
MKRLGNALAATGRAGPAGPRPGARAGGLAY